MNSARIAAALRGDLDTGSAVDIAPDQGDLCRPRDRCSTRCNSPQGSRSGRHRVSRLASLVKVAGQRWKTEENFQAANGLTGLDEHQVRRWGSWYRWTTLAMLATAFLTIAAAAEHARSPAADGQIPLTRNEIAGLFATLVIQPARQAQHRLRWSAWRRRCQHRANPATTSGKPGNNKPHHARGTDAGPTSPPAAEDQLIAVPAGPPGETGGRAGPRSQPGPVSDPGLSIPVMRWSEFESMCPELAGIGQRRLEQQHLCLIGTLRRDGWPRITPVEPYLADGDLMIGMIAGSRKAADLLRDPRLVIHSTVTRWEADEGDVKLYGTAKPVTDPGHRAALYQAMTQAHDWAEPPSDDPAYHVFSVDIETAAYVRFNGSSWQHWAWDPQRGLRKQTHQDTT